MDTGAEANVLPISTLKRLSTKPPIDKTHTRLTVYNGTDIPVMGKCTLDIHHNNRIHSVPFIMNAPGIIPDYKDVYCELGYLKGDHHIDIDPNATPVIQPPCKIQISLMEKLKAELEHMWKLDVIEKN
ncbi:hypothetical protein P5673_024472 [Acropora cervicornis]|uniref:Peptidase A2 domain-containing protein n=1 Tax=Acropora cervicornis TaxID=6130 RepID=A0AAD9UYC3_ACRCE|nr:hypothetical protein P5673_024472 [Acropora cervicornis]